MPAGACDALSSGTAGHAYDLTAASRSLELHHAQEGLWRPAAREAAYFAISTEGRPPAPSQTIMGHTIFIFDKLKKIKLTRTSCQISVGPGGKATTQASSRLDPTVYN